MYVMGEASYLACNCLQPHWSQTFQAAGALCPDSAQHHCHRHTVSFSDFPRASQQVWGPDWKPGLRTPPCFFHCLIQTCLSSALCWSGHCSEPTNQHSCLERCPFVIFRKPITQMAENSPCVNVSLVKEQCEKKTPRLLCHKFCDRKMEYPKRLLRFCSFDYADSQAEPQSTHTI